MPVLSDGALAAGFGAQFAPAGFPAPGRGVFFPTIFSA